jgi:alpha,alpha-trehalose phosphorylase
VHLQPGVVELAVEDGSEVEIDVRGKLVTVSSERPARIEMDTYGPVIDGMPQSPALAGRRREDGTLITATVPTA